MLLRISSIAVIAPEVSSVIVRSPLHFICAIDLWVRVRYIAKQAALSGRYRRSAEGSLIATTTTTTTTITTTGGWLVILRVRRRGWHVASHELTQGRSAAYCAAIARSPEGRC